MNGHILLFSPHSDDIAYSIGGTIAKLIQRKIRNKTMVSVFTKSKYGPGLRTTSAQYVSNIRKREDKRFARSLQLARIDLNFPEPTLRGYTDDKAIFRVGSSDKDPITQKVEGEICRVAKKFGEETILVAPLGLGNHIDHLIVRDACLRASQKHSLNINFYEDLPYAAYLSLNEIVKVIRRFLPDLLPQLSDVTRYLSQKILCLLIYESQQVDLDLLGVTWHGFRVARRPGKVAERFWIRDQDDRFWIRDQGHHCRC